MNADERQSVVDEQHLWMLSFCHYVSGAVTIAFSSIFILHFMFLSFIGSRPELMKDATPDAAAASEAMFGLFAAILGTLIVMGVAYGICEIVSGVFISKRKNRVFSLVVAIPRVLFVPYGSILSVMTFILLDRASVKELYRGANET